MARWLTHCRECKRPVAVPIIPGTSYSASLEAAGMKDGYCERCRARLRAMAEEPPPRDTDHEARVADLLRGLDDARGD